MEKEAQHTWPVYQGKKQKRELKHSTLRATENIFTQLFIQGKYTIPQSEAPVNQRPLHLPQNYPGINNSNCVNQSNIREINEPRWDDEND